MIKYNNEEAILQAWKRKLLENESTKKIRVAAKNTLLKIINGQGNSLSRLIHFEEERNRLLYGKHEQGPLWEDRFSWFWSFLSFFTGNPKKHGSRLRQDLEAGVSLPSFALISGDVHPDNQELNQSQFENALFLNPKAAYCDLIFRCKNVSDIDIILKRLHALKYRLRPDLYQKLLYQHFQSHPNESIRFFYREYNRDPHEIPEVHDYIEHELLAQALMDNFVKNTEPFAQKMYSLQKLIIALVMQDKNQASAFQSFLKENTHLNAGELDRFYGDTSQGLKNQVLQRLPEEVCIQGLTTQSSFCEEWSKTFDFPVAILEAMSEQRYSFRFKNPLLVHLAKLACQELLLLKKTKANWETHSQDMATFSFLCNNILRSWDERKELRLTEEICEQIFNGNLVMVPLAYQNAVAHANRIIVAGLFNLGAAEFQLQSIADSIAHFLNKKLSAPEIYWIVSAIQRAIPDSDALIKKVDLFLSNASKATAFNKEVIKRIENPTVNQSNDPTDLELTDTYSALLL